MVQCTLQEGGMGEKEPQKKFVFRRKPFFLFLLFFLINSMTSCFRMVLSMEFHLQIFLGLLGSALLAAEFFYLPVKKWVRVLLIAGFEIFFLLSQTFYDFCFFITGSDITKEALGNIGVLQMDAAFALWKFWFFFGGGYFLICVACCVLLLSAGERNRPVVFSDRHSACRTDSGSAGTISAGFVYDRNPE